MQFMGRLPLPITIATLRVHDFRSPSNTGAILELPACFRGVAAVATSQVLPQLWSVLRGDMSLVGPRPPVPTEVAAYKTFERRRLSMRPGLTCLWQVGGRNEIGFDDWVRMDLEYIDTWSLSNDLRILARTIPAVVSGEGAS